MDFFFSRLYSNGNEFCRQFNGQFQSISLCIWQFNVQSENAILYSAWIIWWNEKIEWKLNHLHSVLLCFVGVFIQKAMHFAIVYFIYIFWSAFFNSTCKGRMQSFSHLDLFDKQFEQTLHQLHLTLRLKYWQSWGNDGCSHSGEHHQTTLGNPPRTAWGPSKQSSTEMYSTTISRVEPLQTETSGSQSKSCVSLIHPFFTSNQCFSEAVD